MANQCIPRRDSAAMGHLLEAKGNRDLERSFISLQEGYMQNKNEPDFRFTKPTRITSFESFKNCFLPELFGLDKSRSNNVLFNSLLEGFCSSLSSIYFLRSTILVTSGQMPTLPGKAR